jgi:hypothetical protein
MGVKNISHTATRHSLVSFGWKERVWKKGLDQMDGPTDIRSYGLIGAGPKKWWEASIWKKIDVKGGKPQVCRFESRPAKGKRETEKPRGFPPWMS